MRLYAIQLWAQRRGFALAADPAPAQASLFACDRKSCVPLAGTQPALGAWWTVRKPKPDDLDSLCRASSILVTRAVLALPPSCARVLVLGPRDFATGGAAEIYRAGDGWRVLWSQPLRGARPWSLATLSGSDE